MVEDSILAARDRGYAIGVHGTVYRYRVVPIDYTAKGMLAYNNCAAAANDDRWRANPRLQIAGPFLLPAA